MIPINLFKGLIFCTGTFFANFHNGFSGLAIYQGYYYALHPVLLTTITVSVFLFHNQPISKNPLKFTNDAGDTSVSHIYNPRNSQPFTLENLFNLNAWLSKNRISTNSDGSTNNVTAYFTWVRDTFTKQVPFFFVTNLIWGFLSGIVLYYIGFNATSNIIS